MKQYINNGGDGIYAAWSVPYLEPVMSERTFERMNPAVYDGIHYQPGLCPIAESVQPKIMQFKNNYRDLELAKDKIEALRKTILYFG